MAVRPFYIESHIDGRSTDLTGGPVNKMGEMRTTIYQREEGSIIEAFSIECRTGYDDSGNIILTTTIFDKDSGAKIAQKVTRY